ncbi:MAG: helicase-related protein [Candidatus Aminicenantales bacterium]
MSTAPSKIVSASKSSLAAGDLTRHAWRRFIRGPDNELVEKLYVPALSEAIRYDRCCAYFSSSVLSAAARGFAGLIGRLIALGAKAPRPAVRLVVNEELAEDDVRALIETGDTSALEATLAKRFKTPRDLLEKQRLAMLGWMTKSGLLAVRVGVMRQGEGIVHGKFGLVYDASGKAIVFNGSGNESAQGLRANYERLEVSASWQDEERFREYREEFDALWKDSHPHVHTVTLPEALKLKLVKLAPPEPPVTEPTDALARRKAAVLWRFIAEAPYLESGASACEATSPIDLWPHQRVVIEEASAAWPDGRMLCDEVGMGKTIEAIMILRRLMAGRGVARALLLLPAGLTAQWQDELREKGGLVVPRLQGLDTLVWPDGRTQHFPGLAAALEQDFLLMSRETARTESNANILLAARPWDLVLMDEAHAARRGKQEEGEFNSSTLLLNLLRLMQVRRKACGFLLLSATPMQTSPWEPWDLMSILGEGGAWLSDFEGVRGFYGLIHGLKTGTPSPEDAHRAAFLVTSDLRFPPPPAGFARIASPQDGERRLRFVPPGWKDDVIRWLRQGSPLARRMHRNTRKTLRDYHQRGLLPAAPPIRVVVDIPFDFQPPNGPERRVYNAVARYIEKRFEELEGEKPGKGFVMTIYRRRAASSPYALRCSLERRLAGLQRVMTQRASSGYIEETDVPAGLSDADIPEGLDTRAIPASLPTNPEDARREAAEVTILLDQLRALGATDTKRDRFFDRIRDLSAEGRPILVFSEYAETMEYLRDNLANHYAEQVASYSGGGGAFYRESKWIPVTKREITDALKQGTIRYLICTDAASEGLNLQTASALINYDLPWNPSKVEQRIGRIDRIGQSEREIRVYNFLLKDSIDEKVYGALRRRCGLFMHFVGTMQPVLARAQVMLNHPGQFSVDELERIAFEAERNFISAETYLDSEAVQIDQPTPSVTRADIVSALEILQPDYGLQISGHAAKGTVIVKGLENKPITFAFVDPALDVAPTARPLTALSPEVAQIADRLTRPGETLPLVVGSARVGAFRRSCAFWVSENAAEPLQNLAALRARVEEWDGTLPAPEKIAAAARHAQQEAERQVRELESRAAKIEQANLAAQRASAALRLNREVGRLLRCIDSAAADLAQLSEAQAARTGPLAERIRRAKESLGGRFGWTPQLAWELEQFLRTLTPNDQRSRLSGSSIDAAFADHRWEVGKLKPAQ